MILGIRQKVAGRQLASIQCNGYFRGIGHLYDRTTAEQSHLPLDLSGSSLGEVASRSHEGSNHQEGCRQFKADPHGDAPLLAAEKQLPVLPGRTWLRPWIAGQGIGRLFFGRLSKNEYSRALAVEVDYTHDDTRSEYCAWVRQLQPLSRKLASKTGPADRSAPK